MSSPNASKIESTLRNIIADLYRTNNLADLTVKRVRTAAEQKLSLPPGWLKDHSEWRDRSKTFITEEAERQSLPENSETAEDERAEQLTERDEPSNDAKTNKTRRQKDRSETNSKAAPSKKRKSEPSLPQRSKSTRKVIDSDEEQHSSSVIQAEESELSDLPEDESPPSKRQKTRYDRPSKARPKAKSKSTELIEDDVGKEERASKTNGIDDEGSESEMSSLIDEEPVKRVKKPVAPRNRESKPKSKTKSKNADLTPDEVEVKKLKDWLTKCGVRKMWANELAPYESTKQKIAHLKAMLKDVGMDGRPSMAKANEIRERRELAEELEEAQKFDQRWGKSQNDGTGRSAAEAIADLGIEFDDESG